VTRLALWVSPLAWRGALVLAAGLALVVELAFPWEQPPSAPAAAAAAPGELRHPEPPVPIAYAAIAEHPLFHPSRQPWVAPPPPAPPAAHAAPPPPDYFVSGVVLSGSARSAIVKQSGAAKTMLVSEGDTLGGWTLRRIDATGLHFEAAGQTYDLDFPRSRQGGR
jgi:hypothetical protein